MADVVVSTVDKKIYDGERVVRVCNYTDVYYNDQITRDLPLREASASAEQLSRSSVLGGDVVITKDSETSDDIGRPAYVPFDIPNAVYGYHLATYRPKYLGYGRFLRYLFDAASVRYEFKSRTPGVTRVGLNQNTLRNLRVPAPPTPEAIAIADYLDHETAEIDAFIADLRRMSVLSQEEWRARRDAALSVGQGNHATTAKTKTWFAERASHWQEGPLKFLFSISLGKMLDEGRHVAEAEHYPYVRAGDIGDGTLNLANLNRMPFNDREQEKFTIDTGDLLVVEGGSVGTNVVLDRPLEGIYFQKTVNRMRSKAGAVPRFYSEVLNAYRESGVLDTVCNRSTIMHLTADKLGGLVVPVPPIAEQRSIATHLKATRNQVEKLIDECGHAIDLANERRFALISAAVTGRIDVTQRQRPIAEQLEEEVLQRA